MRFKDIVGFEGVYAISDRGDVLRLYRTWVDHLGRRMMRPTKLLKVPTDARGYKTVRLFAEGRYRREKVHRLVAEAFCYPFLGEVVNHRDGERSNNIWSNLEWTTTAGNLMHGQLRKAHVKLDATQICEVRRIYGIVPIETIANRFNIDKSTIHRIMFGKDGRRKKMVI